MQAAGAIQLPELDSLMVRKLLEKSGRVRVVFQGYSHENDRTDLNGITYLTMAAIIEKADPKGGAHSVVEIGRGKMTLEGFARQTEYELAVTTSK